MTQSPDLVVPTAAQVTIFGAVNGATTNHVNVLGAIKVGGVVINQTLANTLASAIGANWTTHLASLMAPGAQFNTVGVRDVSIPSQTHFIGVTATIPGTGVGDQLPAGNAVVVSLKTALSGPRHRGRVYISGWIETENDPVGGIATAATAAAAAYITAVQQTLASNGLTLAVISRPSYATQKQVTTVLPSGETDVSTRSAPARPGEVQAVTGISVRNTVWDSQRRRNSAAGGSLLISQPAAFSYLDETTGQWVTATSTK